MGKPNLGGQNKKRESIVPFDGSTSTRKGQKMKKFPHKKNTKIEKANEKNQRKEKI